MVAFTLTRYLWREIFSHFLGVTTIVIVLSCLRRLTNYIGEAADGLLPIDAVLQLIGIRTIVALPSLLPVALYFAILLALRRLRLDRETTALEICGLHPARLGGMVMSFALCVAALVCVLALDVRARAAQTFDELASVVRVAGLEPQRLYELGREDLVFFAERKGPDGAMEDVFLQRREDGRVSVASSERATEQVNEALGYRFLSLHDGSLYEFGSHPERGPVNITHYREMLVRFPLRPAENEAGRPNMIPTGELLGSAAATDVAELQWRLAMPVSAIVLALTAIVVARVRADLWGLALGIVLYVAYGQSLALAKSWVESGTLPPHPGLWWVPALWLAGLSVSWWRMGGRLRSYHRSST